MKNLTLLLLLLSASARAELVIYKQAYSQTQIGHGQTLTSTFGGYLLVDDSGNLTQIDVNVKAKTYTVTGYDDFNVNYVRTSTGTQFILSIPVSNADIGDIFFQGLVTSGVNTGTEAFNLAKTLTMTGTGTAGTDPDAEAVNYKGKLTYDAKTTPAQNIAGNDIDAATAALESTLTAQGFTQSP